MRDMCKNCTFPSSYTCGLLQNIKTKAVNTGTNISLTDYGYSIIPCISAGFFTPRIVELIANKCLPGDWSDLYKYISAGGYASSDEVHLIDFICLCFLTYIHEWVYRKGAYHEYVSLCTLYPV